MRDGLAGSSHQPEVAISRKLLLPLSSLLFIVSSRSRRSSESADRLLATGVVGAGNAARTATSPSCIIIFRRWTSGDIGCSSDAGCWAAAAAAAAAFVAFAFAIAHAAIGSPAAASSAKSASVGDSEDGSGEDAPKDASSWVVEEEMRVDDLPFLPPFLPFRFGVPFFFLVPRRLGFFGTGEVRLAME